MQNIYNDVRVLDANCRQVYGLTEDIMMENAACALEQAVRKRLSQLSNKNVPIYILTGSGNNGADGYALLRRLTGTCTVYALALSEPKSSLCIEQKKRALLCGAQVLDDSHVNSLVSADGIIVDCVFGCGFHGALDEHIASSISKANESASYRIACDVPTGITQDGTIERGAFCADETICMGALKLSLISDVAKDYVGHISVQNLGLNRTLFESTEKPLAYLLEESDLHLPLRTKNNVHKGSFGHAVCVAGSKPGAAVIASCAALRFGAGLVTLCGSVQNGQHLSLDADGITSSQNMSVPYDLMCSESFPQNTTALALGMGLGHDKELVQKNIQYLEEHPTVACVLDADICYEQNIVDFLKKASLSHRKVVLTPHPKEFAALLKVCGLGEYTVAQVVQNRIALVKEFCALFKNIVLVLKGANVVIAVHEENADCKIFINSFGTSALSKGGSGDVLAGMTLALLAQGQTALCAATNASLAHALASRSFSANFALTPFALINAVASLA